MKTGNRLCHVECGNSSLTKQEEMIFRLAEHGAPGSPTPSCPCNQGRKRSGAATLEFALAFPVFLLLVLGLIEVGRAMMVISLLNNAARSGCREAILPTGTPESVNGVIDNLLKRQGVEGYSVTLLVNGQPAAMTTAGENDLISVQIQVPASKVSWVPGFTFVPVKLQGQYVLPRE